MKQKVEKRKPNGVIDHLSLALTTVGVGYIPGAPGTYGSAVAVAAYILIGRVEFSTSLHAIISGMRINDVSIVHAALNAVLLTMFCLVSIAAAGRSIPLLGSSDPSEAVVDEVMGQLITFCFVPFGLPWPFVLSGFLLFRLFDIWKPYPVRDLEVLPGGLGICADDIVAGVYAGLCLAIGHAVYLFI